MRILKIWVPYTPGGYFTSPHTAARFEWAPGEARSSEGRGYTFPRESSVQKAPNVSSWELRTVCAFTVTRETDEDDRGMLL